MKNKLHIMKQKPPVTEEEIKSYMNFDGVMQQRVLHLKRTLIVKRAAIIFSASVVAVAAYLLSSNDYTPEAKDETSTSTVMTPVDSLVLPEKEKALNVLPDPRSKDDEKASTKLPTQEKKDRKPLEVIEDKSSTATSEYVYQEAEPTEGYPHLYEYFSRELRYPKAALKDSIQGTVSVSFSINKEGKPEKIIIQHSLGELFDQESLRLINNMPAWKPALLNGKPVPARISMPLTFTIIKPTTVNKKQ